MKAASRRVSKTHVFDQATLVLEGVTLGEVVELVVEVLVDLASGTVADEETTENTHAAHPDETRECMVTGLRMMRPSLTSLRTVWRELALEISLISLGSSQILRLPQPTTEAARRFWVRRLTLLSEKHTESASGLSQNLYAPIIIMDGKDERGTVRRWDGRRVGRTWQKC
ncbi:hypothetical protein BDW59DRAFT_84298 [Aspergillus cavernicola]|uniref:Uncharacterized protein n=1 Tax=Aspergillus cavernicola TaxID=176166 RepID=A0ABR4IA50_9EURO